MAERRTYKYAQLPNSLSECLHCCSFATSLLGVWCVCVWLCFCSEDFSTVRRSPLLLRNLKSIGDPRSLVGLHANVRV